MTAVGVQVPECKSLDLLTGSTIVNGLGLLRLMPRADPFTAYVATLIATLLQAAAIAVQVAFLSLVPRGVSHPERGASAV
jgi:hypothetical protein